MRRDGFTLLEILLAITAFSIAVSALVLLERSVVYTVRDFKQEVDQQLRVNALFSQIIFDFNGFYADLEGLLVSHDRLRRGESLPLLSFVTSSQINLQKDRYPVVDVCLVSYLLRTEQGTDRLSLVRTEIVPPAGMISFAPSLIDAPKSLVVIEALQRFELEFVDGNGEKYQDWDSRTRLERQPSGSEGETRFPRSIIFKAQLSRDNRAGNPRYFEKEIHLPANVYGQKQPIS